MSVSQCNLVVTCWGRADFGSLECDGVLCFCHFPIPCPGLGVVLDSIDS